VRVTQPLVIQNRWALGDSVCLSALVRDLHRAHPGLYDVHMSGHYLSLWDNNPYCKALQGGGPRGAQLVTPEYQDGIRESGRGSRAHFLSWFHRDFEQKTGVRVPVTEPKGDIHLSPEEREPLYPSRYWVVVAGGKRDMTSKVWYTHRYQGVVDRLLGLGVKCVQAGADFTQHFHPRLRNVEQAVGKTDSVRDLFRLIYHSDGVVCGITGAMHIAAALEKPCVVIAGGREEWWWENYANFSPGTFGNSCKPVKIPHRFLHTIGLIDCGIGNLDKGCWRDRTVPLDQADHTNIDRQRRLCKRPLRDGPQPMPECMAMISADSVVGAVMSYYLDGTLPPKGAEHLLHKRWVWKLVETDQQADVAAETTPPVGTPPATRPEPPLNKTTLKDVEEAWGGPPKVPAEEIVDYTEEDARRLGEVLPRELRPDDREDPALAVLDHPYLGGRITAFVLCHGDHLPLARRCIGSILDTTPRHRLDLRVALNQPSKATLEYVTGFSRDVVSKVYFDTGGRKKYGAMRDMFHDQSAPITTKYLVWFDDDSHVVDRDWLAKLGDLVVKNHGFGGRLYGVKFLHDLMTYHNRGFKPERWFREALWHTGSWMHLPGGQRVGPNGHVVSFVSGGFWALAAETVRQAQIPDTRLDHQGGDVCIGEQVHQAGGKIVDFCRGKRPVAWSDYPPRGSSHRGPGEKEFPWSRVT
jgi:hypothetical protein